MRRPSESDLEIAMLLFLALAPAGYFQRAVATLYLELIAQTEQGPASLLHRPRNDLDVWLTL